MKYREWLRGQPASVQDEVLGPRRGELYRKGKMDLKELVRTDGSVVTVEELKKKVA